jgi:hypothetical protein
MRSADEVAIRSLCLVAVVIRAYAEEAIGSEDPLEVFSTIIGVQPESAPQKVSDWLIQEGFTDELSPQERFWMNSPVGEWTRRDLFHASWRREALTVLLWSLGYIEPFPSADEEFDLFDLFLHSAYLMRETIRFRQAAKLRSNQEIEKNRDTAEFWLWRVRTTQLQNSPESLTDPRISKEKLDGIIAHAAETGERDGLFRRIAGDFPCFGKPFRELTENEWSLMYSISRERLYSLNWLCDEEKTAWDDIETNT